jgi:hypothetical protein
MNQIEQIAMKEIYNAAKNKQLDQVRAWVQFLDKAPKMRTRQHHGKRRAPVKTAIVNSSRTAIRKKQVRTLVRELLTKKPMTIKQLSADLAIPSQRIWRALQHMHHIEADTKAHGEHVYRVTK